MPEGLNYLIILEYGKSLAFCGIDGMSVLIIPFKRYKKALLEKGSKGKWYEDLLAGALKKISIE